MRRFLILLAGVACIGAATSRSTVKAVSTDGEATVYLTANFARGFNVAYNAVLMPQRQNRSTTFLSMMLIGRRGPSGSIALGVTRGAPSQALRLFVATTTSRGANHYESFPVTCVPACGLVLRGDRYGIYAFAATDDGIRKLGSWARADFAFVKPYLQLNAEVTAPADRIAGTLVPLRLVADSSDLSPPRCAFTTRGVVPRRDPSGMLEFTGTYRPDAGASFIDLRTGKFVQRCPR